MPVVDKPCEHVDAPSAEISRKLVDWVNSIDVDALWMYGALDGPTSFTPFFTMFSDCTWDHWSEWHLDPNWTLRLASFPFEASTRFEITDFARTGTFGIHRTNFAIYSR